ncbi:MAG: DUF5606 domain-containing protein [Mangrovibacterium sp.]
MLKGILAISGQPGLFKLISEGKNSIIVESLLTGKRMPAYSTARISSLAEIAIFTETGEEELKKIFENTKTIKGDAELPKMDNSEMTDLFAEVLPDYDKDRVYTSDIKKVFQWYNILFKNNLLDFSEEEETEETTKAE